ncbi:unnamed protein product [Rhizophagus irregularis]|nr:unnamed protein product [Rhizophagus irregularis]
MMDNNSLLDVHITNYLEHDNENHPKMLSVIYGIPIPVHTKRYSIISTFVINNSQCFVLFRYFDVINKISLKKKRLTFLRRVQFYAFGTLQVDLKNITKCQNAFIYSLIALPLPSDIF